MTDDPAAHAPLPVPGTSLPADLASREELERALSRLALVHDIDRAILAAERPSDIAARVVEQLRRLAGADRVAVAAFDLGRRVSRVLAFSQEGVGGAFPAGAEVPLDAVVDRDFLERRTPVVHRSLREVVESLPGLRTAVEQGMRSAVLVPLVAGDRLVGAVSLIGRDEQVASADNVAVATEVAAQLAVAIEHATATEAARRVAGRLALVHEIDAAILRAESPHAIAEAVSRRLLELTAAEMVGIARVGRPRTLLAVAGVGAERVVEDLATRPLPPAGGAIDPSGAPLVFDDLRAAADRIPGFALAVEQGMTVGMLVPLVQAGRVVGALTLCGRDRVLVDDDSVAVAREVGDQLSIAIVHADARAELERSLEQRRLVHEIDRGILAAESVEDLAARVAEPLARLTGARRLDISAYDLARDEGRIIGFAHEGEQPARLVGDTYPLRAVVPMVDAPDPAVMALDDLASRAHDVPLVRSAVAAGLTHGAWVPLVAGGRLLGGIGLASDDPALTSEPVLSIARAMGDQLAVALQVHRDRAALAEREARLRAILEASPNGIVTVEASGIIQYANPAAHRLFGAPDGALPGMHHASIVPVASEPLHGQRVREWLAGPYPVAPHAPTIEARRLDGSSFPVHVLLARVEGPTGPLAIATVVDLSERTTLEARLRQAERLEVLGTFAGILAHDVRNHLTAIAWSADLLGMDLPPEDPRQDDLELIRRATQDAVDMTRSVLEFARPTGDPTGRVEVGAHLAGARAVLRRVLGDPVSLELDVEDGLPEAALNPTALTQVIGNLASNAREAMPSGGTFRIVVREHTVGPAPARENGLLQPGRYVRLVVSDTGIGMDEATRLRAFEAFYSTKTMASTARGTGLGLSSVFLIVTKAGGGIAVASLPGQGTTFTVDLPVAG